MVFDYFYKYNLNDYFNWVLVNGESETLKQSKEIQSMSKKLTVPDFFRAFHEKARLSADTTIGLLYDSGEHGNKGPDRANRAPLSSD